MSRAVNFRVMGKIPGRLEQGETGESACESELQQQLSDDAEDDLGEEGDDELDHDFHGASLRMTT